MHPGLSESANGIQDPLTRREGTNIQLSVAKGRNGERNSADDRDVQAAFGVAGAQHLLVELADTGLRHLADERPALRHLPLRHLAGEELFQLVSGHRLALGEYDSR